MTFNVFTTERVSCFGQYNRIDDLITCKLRGNKRAVFRKFLVDEFYFSSVLKGLDPLFVWHRRISTSRKIRGVTRTIGAAPRVHFSLSRADLAMRGLAISFLTARSVALPDFSSAFFLRIQS